MPRRAELRRRSGEGRFQESRIREKKGIWNVHDGKGNWKTHQDYYFACGGRIERCEYAPTFMSDFVQSTYRDSGSGDLLKKSVWKPTNDSMIVRAGCECED